MQLSYCQLFVEDCSHGQGCSAVASTGGARPGPFEKSVHSIRSCLYEPHRFVEEAGRVTRAAVVLANALLEAGPCHVPECEAVLSLPLRPAENALELSRETIHLCIEARPGGFDDAEPKAYGRYDHFALHIDIV